MLVCCESPTLFCLSYAQGPSQRYISMDGNYFSPPNPLPHKEDDDRESALAEVAEHVKPHVDEATSPQLKEGEEWGTPTEFHSVEQQTNAVASLGWGLVHKGADLAKAILGSLTDSEHEGRLSELAEHLKHLETPSSAAAVEHEQPLDKLRACQGYLAMLRRQLKKTLDTEALCRATAAKAIQPHAVAELTFTDQLFQDCVWIEGSMVGKRIVKTRKMMTSLVDQETGERLEDGAILEELPKFTQMSADASDAIANLVIEELSELFARPDRSVSSTLAELLVAHRQDQEDTEGRGAASYWFLHHRKSKDTTWASFISQNIIDLVAFAFCEMHYAAEDLHRFGRECAGWAQREEREDASIIVEMVAKQHADALKANTKALAALEEALTIVVELFPEEEGTMPFEPIRVGQGVDYMYVNSDVQIVETEHGKVAVEVGDRHDREHHAQATSGHEHIKSV
jgi:hypothetical protein